MRVGAHGRMRGVSVTSECGCVRASASVCGACMHVLASLVELEQDGVARPSKHLRTRHACVAWEDGQTRAVLDEQLRVWHPVRHLNLCLHLKHERVHVVLPAGIVAHRGSAIAWVGVQR